MSFIYYYYIPIEMSKINWYTTLLSSNTNYKLYTRANNSHFVMDTGPRLEVLDIHSQFLDILKDSDAGYYYINVKQEKIWVPILHGFTILLTLKTVFPTFY